MESCLALAHSLTRSHARLVAWSPDPMGGCSTWNATTQTGATDAATGATDTRDGRDRRPASGDCPLGDCRRPLPHHTLAYGLSLARTYASVRARPRSRPRSMVLVRDRPSTC